tara:strand:- start:911091 stop:911744 length:654 start_codon:yes stop_codon:yes gene_type:complete
MSENDAKSKSLAMDPATIDRLVREVIRRLTAIRAGDGHAGPSPRSDAVPRDAYTINERVVTIATLDRMPNTSKQINVPPNAIVTPAARDEARQRNIVIVRGTTQQTNKQSTGPSGNESTRCGIQDALQPQRAASIAAQLTRRGIGLPKATILLSETPGRDVYEQCSQHGQRSVMVTSLVDIDRFDAELSPTSWVLDMTRMNFIAATNAAARIAQLQS